MCFSNIIWALANWRAAPGDIWLSHFTHCSTRTLPRLGTDEVAALMQGLSDLEYKPPKVRAARREGSCCNKSGDEGIYVALET